MKPMLLLGPARPGGPPLERWLVELRRAMPAEQAAIDAGDYSAVIVINDGGAHALRRLLAAFEMRERQEELRIAVLSYLDEANQRRPALMELDPRFKVEFKEETIRFEYQAV